MGLSSSSSKTSKTQLDQLLSREQYATNFYTLYAEVSALRLTLNETLKADEKNLKTLADSYMNTVRDHILRYPKRTIMVMTTDFFVMCYHVRNVHYRWDWILSMENKVNDVFDRFVIDEMFKMALLQLRNHQLTGDTLMHQWYKKGTFKPEYEKILFEKHQGRTLWNYILTSHVDCGKKGLYRSLQDSLFLIDPLINEQSLNEKGTNSDTIFQFASEFLIADKVIPPLLARSDFEVTTTSINELQTNAGVKELLTIRWVSRRKNYQEAFQLILGRLLYNDVLQLILAYLVG